VKAVAIWTGIILAALTLLVLVAWAAMFFSWQFRIRGAIRALEGQLTSQETDIAVHTLTSAGCRALPYLVASLDTANADSELPELTVLIFGWSCSKSGMSDDPEPRFQEDFRFLDGCRMTRGKTPESRRRSFDRIRTWWSESGAHYHSWWRVWTSSCRKGT
jgi:hypothetical protein